MQQADGAAEHGRFEEQPEIAEIVAPEPGAQFTQGERADHPELPPETGDDAVRPARRRAGGWLVVSGAHWRCMPLPRSSGRAAVHSPSALQTVRDRSSVPLPRMT